MYFNVTFSIVKINNNHVFKNVGKTLTLFVGRFGIFSKLYLLLHLLLKRLK